MRLPLMVLSGVAALVGSLVRRRTLVAVATLLLFCGLPSEASAIVIDVTNLSALPPDISATPSDVGGIAYRVDGVINAITLDAFFTVNGVAETVDPFIMGTIFLRGPNTTGGGIELAPSLTEPTYVDLRRYQYDDTYINYVNASYYFTNINVTLFFLAQSFNVPIDALDYGYRITTIDYTPTNVPEPATWLLSALGVSAYLYRQRRST